MAENSKIQWTDHTFNPWVGCKKVSPACDNCYAELWAKRAGRTHLWQGKPPERTSPDNWSKPIKWNRQAQQSATRKKVFCASLADVFDDRAPQEWRNDFWTLIKQTPWLDWQILTKRPENMFEMLPSDWGYGYANVWLGVTVENREQARWRIPYLRNLRNHIPCVTRFLSCEPLLEDITPLDLTGIDWVICGGESGGNARIMLLKWACLLKYNCEDNKVPFFMKQLGAVSDRLSKSSGEEKNDEWDYIPPYLRVREFPVLRENTEGTT